MSVDHGVIVRVAADSEVDAAVRLRWLWTVERGDQPPSDERDFVAHAAQWAREHRSTHLLHVAVAPDGDVVGMAWLALTPRVPTTRRLDRWAGDLQSCYVLPAYRDRGVGGALARAVLESAKARGAEHVTVHASPESVRMYARNGFRVSDRLLWADVAVAEG